MSSSSVFCCPRLLGERETWPKRAKDNFGLATQYRKMTGRVLTEHIRQKHSFLSSTKKTRKKKKERIFLVSLRFLPLAASV